MSKHITLTQGKQALVDDEDYERVMRYNWYVSAPRNCIGWYARTNMPDNGRQRTVYLHTFVLEFPDCDYIDHINQDTLDNRKSNLRLATTNESIRHRHLPLGRSGYRGVTRSGEKWIARVATNETRVYLGTYDTAEEAARVYDDAARVLHNEFAILNFPEQKNG
jgi:hypothetical protein